MEVGFPIYHIDRSLILRRFVTLGLDLFVTAYRRGIFNFNDSEILSRLEPMVSVIGNTLYSNNGNVASSGLKAISQMIKSPLKSVEESLPVFVRQTFAIIRQTGSTESDLTQTAFKTLAVMIRDHSSSQVKEKDLIFLLELVTPDLEEVSRQATAFSLLRAIVSRKFVVPEIYDVMDKVREIMVTAQSPQVQELCRGVMLQFLLDYPQGKGRLKQNFAFLVKNLSYVFETGRLSVMELLSAIISKFNDDIIAEYGDMLFVALVMVIGNDESTKCREAAAQLIKSLVARLNAEQRKQILSHIHSWASQDSNPTLIQVSMQSYGLMVESLKDDMIPDIPLLLRDVNEVVKNAANSLEEADENDSAMIDEGWQSPYQALMVLTKVFQNFPDLLSNFEAVSWAPIVSLLLYPHTWVRTASCRLLGSLFSVQQVAIPDSKKSDDFPLSHKGMFKTVDYLSMQLKSKNLDDALSLQIVKNMFYIGKCFYVASTEQGDKEEEDESHDEHPAATEDDSDNEDDDMPDKEKHEHSPLPWLFSRLSFQMRSAHIARRNKKVEMVRPLGHIQ